MDVFFIKIVIYAATWDTFKPKPEKILKRAPKKNLISLLFSGCSSIQFFNSPIFPERKIHFENCSLTLPQKTHTCTLVFQNCLL